MSDRLIGVETEYSLFFVPASPGGRAPLPREIYELVEHSVRCAVPTLPSSMPKGGVFLANGGLMHYEAPTVRFSTGLLEAASPECRGPLEAARYHHATDRLLASVHAEVEDRLRRRGYEGELAICKASADAAGNVWGSHENYEVDDPPGIARRLLLIFGFPAFWVPLWIVEFLLRVLLYAVFLTGAAAFIGCSTLGRVPLLGRPFASVARALHRLGRAVLREDSLVRLMDLTYAVTLPWIRAYSAFLRAAVLPRFRAPLLPHLVTRLVWCGPGSVSSDARVTLSQKAPSIRAVAGVYWDDAIRPVFDLKNFVREPWSVFRRKKRMQILLSDSNMSRLATALKLGTTDLVLRMIEAGHPLRDLRPRDLREAIALVTSDTTLRQQVPLACGERWTALDVQRYYLGEAEKFFGKEAGGETGEILSKWRYVLEALEEDPHLLYKDVDWVAKRDLVAAATRAPAGAVATAVAEPAAQKLDARFHELGPRGYWTVLEEASQVRPYFTEPELLRAMREPPSAPTAKARGDAVRRHSGDERDAKVSWTHLWLRRPRERRRF